MEWNWNGIVFCSAVETRPDLVTASQAELQTWHGGGRRRRRRRQDPAAARPCVTCFLLLLLLLLLLLGGCSSSLPALACPACHDR